MDTDRDLYQLLQVDPAAEQEVVQAAYKRLAFKYHPDKNASADAHQRMQELNEAYAIIGDPARRAAYDRQRQIALAAQHRIEDEARYQAEAEHRAELARQRKEQMAAQRRAENARQEAARAASAQRRTEYEQRIRQQMAAQRHAKHERQQREWAEQQARDQAAATPLDTPAAEPLKPIEPQVPIESEPNPITDVYYDAPRPSERELRQMTLIQSQRALQNEIFKLDYGITDAVERLKYWSNRHIPWEFDLQAGQGTKFMIGGAVALIALVLAGFGLWLGSGFRWVASCGLIGVSVGWWTWRTCVVIVPVKSFVTAWTQAKSVRELQLQHVKEELAQLEAAMQVEAGGNE
ncbi:MAG: DnaJ domain-containing protein [Thermoflexales bacterium]|nr:DnaJ domain-containing protein [Thermoflexales bacterium]